MKAKKIKKIRKLLNNKDYLIQQLRRWADFEKELQSFYTFKCSIFFEGQTNARLNIIEYYKKYRRCNTKIRTYKKLLDITDEN
ncbi:MAG TPA: hypothetical protein VK705_04245 [Ferruginibacter sp.]|jgi:hypothetical protein|nr:hypothetical protein [Ferruginibacter sp.]